MRLFAGSTAQGPGVAFRQTPHAGLYGGGWKRSNARRGCASAVGNHARGLGAGCWAGRSACPWPRRSPRCVRLECPSHPAARTLQLSWSAGRPGLVGACRATGRRGPQAVISASVWVAAVSPTFGRLSEGTDVRSPGQTWPLPTHHDPPPGAATLETSIGGQPNPRPSGATQMNLGVMLRNCWQPNRKLLASVSDWSGGRQTQQGWQNDGRLDDPPGWSPERSRKPSPSG
jgi:hypothetical protein